MTFCADEKLFRIFFCHCKKMRHNKEGTHEKMSFAVIHNYQHLLITMHCYKKIMFYFYIAGMLREILNLLKK
jgi:hypothetical protein